MYKLPNVPAVSASVHELADFAELTAWMEDIVSQNTLSRRMRILAENDYHEGVPEDDMTENQITNVFTEIQDRVTSCGGGYPFEVADEGYTLRLRTDGNDVRHLIYMYLLLATRMDMKNNRRQANIDGTAILEELSAEVARNYLGERAESMVFGTAGSLRFSEKVERLCKRICEGGGFRQAKTSTVMRDGRLDVVAWKHFADRRVGKLIAFGQCKTGTSYKDSFTQLRPDSFCNRWLRSSLVCPPVRMFFLADSLSRDQLESNSWDAGLIFDRCRIVDFSSCIGTDIVDRIERWTAAAREVAMLSVDAS